MADHRCSSDKSIQKKICLYIKTQTRHQATLNELFLFSTRNKILLLFLYISVEVSKLLWIANRKLRAFENINWTNTHGYKTTIGQRKQPLKENSADNKRNRDKEQSFADVNPATHTNEHTKSKHIFFLFSLGYIYTLYASNQNQT